ncbi:hypothetical protein C8J56DRAFT_917928 [Mycena floridula]|nr:hypothetical protein C8J56DRAFT_917928 [Mycena floridula]
MTTRVQKGGAIFKPAKSRARSLATTSVRQPSESVPSLSNPEPPVTAAAGPSSSTSNAITSSIPTTTQPELSILEAPIIRPHPPIVRGPPILKPSRQPESIILKSTAIPIPQPAQQLHPAVLPVPNESTFVFANNFTVPQETPLEPIPEPIPGPTPDAGKIPKTTRTSGRRKKSDAATVEASGDDAESSVGKKRRKSSSKEDASRKRSRKGKEVAHSDEGSDIDGSPPSKSRRKKRKKSPPPPYDPDADPGEEIDPTTVTMAVLCEDTGFGRVSSKAAEIQSNHVIWKSQLKAKRAEMRARLERKKYGAAESDEEAIEKPDQAPPLTAETANTGSDENEIQKTVDNPDEFDYSQDLSTSRFNVQVRIGPNGETIIDEESLVVDRVDGEEATEGYTHVVESDISKFTNSGTYGKRLRGSRWSAEETELFYNALSQYGENYELIAYVLPGRDRKSCKNKFKAEDKRNHARINYCLKNTVPVDIQALSRMTGKDFSGPVPAFKIPSPPPQIPIEPDNTKDDSESTSVKIKRRSQSRKLASQPPEDGVVVIGDAGDIDPGFAPSP